MNFRQDFPILKQQVNPSTSSGEPRPLCYLDNAATTQKPLAVIEAVADFYKTYNANVHRGIHTLSEKASVAYEGARQKIADFIKARSVKEIIYTRGTTEGINLVASSWGRVNLRSGDEIILTIVNHHSNILPWQMLAKEKGAVLKWLEIEPSGRLNLEQYRQLLASGKVKLVALTHISNTLGTIYDVKSLTLEAHRGGALALVD